LSLDLDREFGRFSAGASWQAVSSSYDDEANRNRIGGYGLLGLRGSWAASDELKLEAKLDNLLDRSYSRALYSYEGAYHPYREEGRTVLFSITWTPAL
jgi:vitamin B12 transporter